MAADYFTFGGAGASEYVDRKSRFIGEAWPCATPEEAEERIAAARKKYYDARHHCWGFVAGVPGTPEEITRSGDDGEPQGTAGKPILEVITGRKLHRALIIVTRYFGGTLLGTGGLVRAYSSAAREAAENAGIVVCRAGVRLRVSCGYGLVGKMQYIFGQKKIRIDRTDYAEDVTFEIIVPAAEAGNVKACVTDAANGAVRITDAGACTYTESVPEG